MYLDYSNIKTDLYGRPEVPELQLRTLAGDVIGILPYVSDLQFNIKFAELSEMEFEIPRMQDGKLTPFYDNVTGYKVIYTEHYGIYITMNPNISGDGLQEVKQVKAYSIEKELDIKKFFLEEGTFNFWNPVTPSDTVLGRVLEIASDWNVGYVSPSLIGRYRTFDSYNEYLLSFIYGSAPEKYRCAFVFDPYDRTINVYDIDEHQNTLPIYLDFDNLINELNLEEMSDELVTAMQPYGSDGLDIRDVNPTGNNWIYDLSYFIRNGDIHPDLANKWESYQLAIESQREYYTGLVALRASATARLLQEQAALVDLKNELQNLTNQQSALIQIIAEETDKTESQKQLDSLNIEISAKKNDIETKETSIKSINDELNDESSGYNAQILAVNKSLSASVYFSEEEYLAIKKYFIEQDFNDDTFIASTVDTAIGGTTVQMSSAQVSISGSDITRIKLQSPLDTTMYTISGGAFVINTDSSLSGDIIRGTIELRKDQSLVMSVYAGTMKSGDTTAPSGLITLTGKYSGLSDDTSGVVVQGETISYQGTKVSFSGSNMSNYMTTNVSEYQKYSVSTELFEFTKKTLSDVATPTYEFDIDTANFIFAHEFEPFKNKLELGSGVYIRMHDESIVNAAIIEISISFDETESLNLVFSNRFQRKDNVNTLKSMVESSYSSSRKFDASKFVYNQTSNKMSYVTEFMNSSFDAAKNSILAGSEYSVEINGAGIHVGGDSKHQLRIIDSMIAMTDDGWNSAKLAIGYFNSDEVGKYWGVNAEVIGGKLIIGNNLVLENATDDGIMQFKVDATGAYLNNSTFVLQKDNGGKILIDPKYGIMAGPSLSFKTDGTTITPGFIDEDGDIVYDDSKLPENSNFYLNINTGNAYFRGNVQATEGAIGGWKLVDDKLYCGSNNTYVALNSSATNDSLYAIWAGSESASSAKFYVRRDGTMYATGATFSGDIKTSTINGEVDFGSNGAISLGTAGQIENNKAKFYSAEIYGGLFYATGKGSTGTEAAYYIHSGTVNESNPSSNRVGFISYDTGGSGGEYEEKNRVIFKTIGMPLKIESGTNMSISAGNDGYIHVGSPLHVRNKLVLGSDSYGSGLPSNPTPGQVFFLLDES